MASEKKDGKAFRGQRAYCMFFLCVCVCVCITAMVENEEAEAGERRND